MAFSVAVITISDRAAAGVYEDRSGPLARQLFEEAGFACAPPIVVADEESEIAAAVSDAGRAGARAIITTGGTGVGPRDNTPEISKKLAPKEIPGIMEAIRTLGAKNSPFAALSRGWAGIIENQNHAPTLLVNAPGSPGGVRDTIEVLAPLLAHLIGQLDGADH